MSLKIISFCISLALSLFALTFSPAVVAAPPSNASVQKTPAIVTNTPPNADEKVAHTISLLSDREFCLSIIILIFGVFIIGIEYFLLRGVVKEKTEEIARTYTVTLIIIGTLVLISAGFTNAQIAPALGLFGTIAGYLLGRIDQQAAKSKGANEHDSKDEVH